MGYKFKVGDKVRYVGKCQPYGVEGVVVEEGNVPDVQFDPSEVTSWRQGRWMCYYGSLVLIKEAKMEKQEIAARIEEVEGELAQLRAELEEVDTDVTEELEVEVHTNERGFIRVYLLHNGEVVWRAGDGKVPSLTSYAEENGYRIERDGEGLRGYYFKIHQDEDC